MKKTIGKYPLIVAAAHAAPAHDISQDFVKAAAAQEFAGKIDDLEKILAIFDHSRIRQRQFVRPPDWYRQPHTWAERNRIYQEEGLELMVQAAQSCLDSAGCRPQDVDQIIFVSSTGFATPTLDAYLVNRLGFKSSVSRLPVWGLGCAAGAAGISRAADYCLARPRSRSLLVALEICSLAFMAGDLSKKNLVATSLFGDGAGAVLLAGAETGLSGPRVRASFSHLFPDSYRIMGWDFLDEGMQLVLSPRLPAIVSQNLAPLVSSFLAQNGLQISDMRHYFTHPGGARVVDAYREALHLAEPDMALTEEVLSRHGNISSVSVLAVLEKWFRKNARPEPGFGLLSAFGPGFSAELVLLEV
jgi:alkylresorcinol/alkylpyrone synthase